MAVYSVFEPPMRDESTVEHAERFAFVRDAFSWSALIFGPLWILRYRMWLVLFLYLVVVGLLMAALAVVRVPPGTSGVVLLLVALLMGLEGNSLRRWTLRRRGWRDLGVVVGDDLQAAERRFFDGWFAGGMAARSSVGVHRNGGVAQGPGHRPDVIGLFPEPGASR